MPYWGACVKSKDYYVEAKIHGGEDIQPVPEDLIEYILNISDSLRISDQNLARFFAEKIATSFREIPFVLFVSVEVYFNNGNLYGHTCLMETEDNS